MCLGVPGKVLAVEGNLATVDFFGVKQQVRTEICDAPVAVGDYILNHVGFAIHRIPEDEVEETLALFDRILKAGQEDLMAGAVRGEMEAAGAPEAAPPAGDTGDAGKEEPRGE